MRFISGVPILTDGPDVSTSLCGMTSLFRTVRVAPRESWTTCVALYAPPFNDHVWQPRIWWRMVSVVAVPWADAADTISAAEHAASAATRRRMRFFFWLMTSPSICTECEPVEDSGHQRRR